MVADVPTAPRRTVLLGVVSALALLGTSGGVAHAEADPPPAVAFPVAPVTPTPQPNDPTIFQYEFQSDVPSNLRVKEYWAIITSQRPKTWQSIAQQIATGSYDTLALSLDAASMADIRQATLYLPWGLMQNSEYGAAVESFKAFKTFNDHVKDLQVTGSRSWGRGGRGGSG